MGRTFEGTLVGTGLRIAIVVARFNDLITRSLLEGARDGLDRHGVAAADVDVVWVPGSFEIPLVARTLAASRRYDAVLCLGAVNCGAGGSRRSRSSRIHGPFLRRRTARTQMPHMVNYM